MARLVNWSRYALSAKEIATNRMDFMALLYLDVSAVVRKMPAYVAVICGKMPKQSGTEERLIEKCFDESETELRSCLKAIEKQWSDELIAQTSGWTKQVADIPRLYRKTNRDAPTKPCSYVEQMLKPMLDFWATNSERIPRATLRDCLVLSIAHLNRQ